MRPEAPNPGGPRRDRGSAGSSGPRPRWWRRGPAGSSPSTASAFGRSSTASSRRVPAGSSSVSRSCAWRWRPARCPGGRSCRRRCRTCASACPRSSARRPSASWCPPPSRPVSASPRARSSWRGTSVRAARAAACSRSCSGRSFRRRSSTSSRCSRSERWRLRRRPSTFGSRRSRHWARRGSSSRCSSWSRPVGRRGAARAARAGCARRSSRSGRVRRVRVVATGARGDR